MFNRSAFALLGLLLACGFASAQERGAVNPIISGPNAELCFEATPNAGADTCIKRTGPGSLNVTPGIGTGVAIGGNGVGSGAAPITSVYLGPQCPVVNTGQCFFTQADTQQSQACSWTAATPSTVTCGSQLDLMNASVTTNVVTYTGLMLTDSKLIPPTWLVGHSITVTNFGGGDAFLNQTCTLTAVSTNTVSCPLPHANFATAATQSGVVTNTSIGPFVAADIGKQVFGWNNCEAFATNLTMGQNAITVSGAPLVTSFISQTQVQITTAANAMATQTGCFIWGHTDDANAAIAEAAYVQYPFCPKLMLSAVGYMFSKPHFYNQPMACAAEGVAWPNSAGNVFYSAGMELEGRGAGATILYIPPNFPNGDTCTRGEGVGVCWFIPMMAKWKDLQFTGGSNPNASLLAHAFMGGQVITVENVTCTNLGAYEQGGPWHGFEAGWQVQLYQYNNSGCGSSSGLKIIPNRGVVTGRFVHIENNLFSNLQVGQYTGPTSYSFTCYDCAFTSSQNANIAGGGGSGGGVISNSGGKVLLYAGQVNNGGNPITGQVGYSCNTNAGCVFSAHDTSFSFASGGGGSSISCAVACTNYLENTLLTSGGAGNSYKDVAGSILYDLGGNNIAQSTVSIVGLVADSRSITGVASATGNWALTSGWGTSTVPSAVGDSHRTKVSVTTTVTGSASPVLTWTFPKPFLVAPATCSMSIFSNATITNVIPGTPTATSVAFTLVGTPTATTTYIFDASCGP